MGPSEDEIDLIYDAAVDPSRWPDLLERLADSFGAGACSMAVRDVRTDAVDGFFARADRTTFERYTRYPFDSNPLNAGAWAPVGRFLSDEQQVAKPILVRSDYYQGFLRPSAIHSTLTAALWRDPQSRCVLNITRPEGADPFDGDDLVRANTLGPHLVRAAGVSARLARLDVIAAGAETALDAVPHGIVLADPRGRILFANREAEAIAGVHDGFSFGPLGLTGARPAETASLARAIHQAARPNGESAALRLTRPSGDRPIAVLVVPLRRETDWLGTAGFLALVVITDPERGHLPPESRLASLYGLTRTEAAVALQLLAGLDLAEIAGQRRISVPTARLHLHRILGKTGAARQSDLVRLLLRESFGVR
jgi:DNA-binding CsgD family transcriptional regulator/PAS domain-containing protein